VAFLAFEDRSEGLAAGAGRRCDHRPVRNREARVFTIDPAAASPPYAQVRAQVAERIRDGSLPVGSRLPTVRALAADLDLAPNTVARAYRELEAAHLIETQGRRGTFVAASRSDVVRQAQLAAQAYAAAIQALGVAPEEALDLVTAALEPSQAWRGPGQPPDLRRGE
jgi:DNA-binding transcriptional regulator YhcF (GntR family)